MDPEDIAFLTGESGKADRACRCRNNQQLLWQKKYLKRSLQNDIDPDEYVEEHGLKTVNDEGALRDTIAKVIEENPQSVEDYRNGKEKAIGFLVGQTMKAMKGKANPGMVNKILKELL